MRSVAVLIAPLLTLLICSGPALAGQRSSHTVIVHHFANRPVVVVPHSRVVIVDRPFVTRPFIVERPFVTRPFVVERPFVVRPFVDRQIFVDRQVVIVRRSGFGSPVIVDRTFMPQRQVFVFDSFGRRLN